MPAVEAAFAEGDRAMAVMAGALARALDETVSDGAKFDGLMEAADALRACKLTREAMRSQAQEWLAAGYALRDAELRAERAARGGTGRHGMRLVAAG